MRAKLPVWIAVGLAGFIGCKMKRDAGQVAMEAPAMEMRSMESAGSAGPAGGFEDKESKGDAKPADKAARTETWKRSQIVPNSSRVMVGDREELALRSMQTRVTIDGFRARVVIDYLYANERDSTLEGTFQLRLPEDASPYFFAFGETRHEAKPMVIAVSDDDRGEPGALIAQRRSAWTAPREARMVPREKAAFAYGQTVRRRVDPALVEWAGAGVFSARVFPLAPRAMHRIVVGYDVDLTRIGGDLEYRLDLPEQAPLAIVDIAADPRAQITGVTGRTAGGRKLFHLENPRDRTIAVRIANPGAPLLVGSDDAAGAFFATRVVPALPATGAAASDRAVFLVDTSLSANPDRFNIWLKLLAEILERNRGSLAQFNVVFFSVDAHWYRPGFIANTPGNVAELLAFAGTLALEGATDLGAALGEAAHPAWLSGARRHDLFLLSDGAATWGTSDLHALGRTLDGAGSLFAYQTGLAGTDVATLVHLARETGGAVFSVTGESEIAAAATAHRARSWRLTGVEVTGGSDVLVAGNPTALYPGQSMLVVGRGALTAGAALALTVEQDGVRRVVKTPLGAPVVSALAPRAYGQVATAHLEELEAATEPEARAYATHFRITGRACSLLMLDSERDYERFGIRPDADAYVVKATPAGALFAKALTETYAALGDPKAAFLALLARLERNPDIHLEIPASYRTAVAQMPPEAFAVPSAALATKLRTAGQIGADLAPRLARHELDYVAITAEAAARRASSPADALKALSSLVEDNPGDAVLARDVGFSAMDLGLHAQAFHLFRRVADARPHEPQTYRAMAQALAAMGKLDLALAYYEIPLMGQWDRRFGDLRKIVELDYLRFLRRLVSGNASQLRAYAGARLDGLARQIGITRADLVITITWNTDNTDVDLHVTEPTGEECFYGHRETRSGGQLTQDVTQGYGPEMYVLRRAPHGHYGVRAHYFASDANRASARTKVYATIYENWGTPEEKVTDKVVTLEAGREFHAIATLER